MKRLLVTTSLALSLCCGAAFAQQTTDPQSAPQSTPTPGEHHHHAPNPEKQAAFLTRKLNLNADQSAKIEPVLAQRDQQMQALHENGQLAPEDRHQQMKSINQQAQQQMATILTPDQMAQLKTMRRHGHGHHNQDGDQPTQAPSA